MHSEVARENLEVNDNNDFFFSTVADIPVRPDIHVVLHAIGPRHGSLLGGFLSEVG